MIAAFFVSVAADSIRQASFILGMADEIRRHDTKNSRASWEARLFWKIQ